MKGMFLFRIDKFFCYIIVSVGMGRGSNKLSQKEALPEAQNPINFTECF